MIKKLLCLLLFMNWSLPMKAEIKPTAIFVLGSLDKETKQLFKETINDQIHSYAQTISVGPQSNIYVFPYRSEDQLSLIHI